MARGGAPAGNPSPALPPVGRTWRLLASEIMVVGAEDLTDVGPFASQSTGMGTTVAASSPLASPDLSLPAPSWFLTRSRGSADPGPAGRATASGLGLVGSGVSVRRPGSFPVACRKRVSHLNRWRSVRAQAHLPFWRRIPGPSEALVRGAMVAVVPGASPCWKWHLICPRLVEVEAYYSADLVNHVK